MDIDLATPATHNLQLYPLPQEDPHQLIVQQNTKGWITLPMLCHKTPPMASHPSPWHNAQCQADIWVDPVLRSVC